MSWFLSLAFLSGPSLMWISWILGLLGVFYMKLEELGQGDKSLLLVLWTASSFSVFCAKDEGVRPYCH